MDQFEQDLSHCTAKYPTPNPTLVPNDTISVSHSIAVSIWPPCCTWFISAHLVWLPRDQRYRKYKTDKDPVKTWTITFSPVFCSERLKASKKISGYRYQYSKLTRVRRKAVLGTNKTALVSSNTLHHWLSVFVFTQKYCFPWINIHTLGTPFLVVFFLLLLSPLESGTLILCAWVLEKVKLSSISCTTLGSVNSWFKRNDW